MAVLGRVLIDGEPIDAEHAAISVLDVGFQRGYGCFEALRVYQGKAFRQGAHLDRLRKSAAKLHIPMPDRDDLDAWCNQVAAESGESVVRVFVSGGSDPRNLGTNSRTIVLAEDAPTDHPAVALQSRIAPWHTDSEWFELTGAKALSYGFNLAASVAAQADGFDDALLIGRSGHVLEGPNFSVGWVTDEVFHTPALDTGILESITRRAVIEVAERGGIQVHEGVFELQAVLDADEMLALSTIKEVSPVRRVDDREYPDGPVTAALAKGFTELVAEELGL